MKNLKVHIVIFYFVSFLIFGCQSPNSPSQWSERTYQNLSFYTIPEYRIEYITYIDDSLKSYKNYENLKNLFIRIRESFSNSNMTCSEAEWFYQLLKSEIKICDCHLRRGSDPPIKPIYYPDRVLIKKYSQNNYYIFYPIFCFKFVKYYLLNISLNEGLFSSKIIERWEIKTKTAY